MGKRATQASLEGRYNRARLDIEALKRAIEKEAAIIADSQSKKRKLEADLRTAQHVFSALSELQVIEAGLPKDVLALRRRISAQIRQSESKNITVAKRELLDAKIREGRAQLQKLCRHPLVFSYDGYGGSRSYDYDDARYGSRVCAICSLSEKSKSVERDEYSVLAEAPHCFPKRDLRKEEERRQCPQFLETSLVLEVFRRSAGHANLTWPDEKMPINPLSVSRP